MAVLNAANASLFSHGIVGGRHKAGQDTRLPGSKRLFATGTNHRMATRPHLLY
jgi:hypothetical protein